MTGRWLYVVLIAVAVLGAILIIIGGVLVPVFNYKISHSSKQFLIPENNSDAFEAWLNWSHFKPVYRSFNFFNVTNPEEIISTGKNTTVNQIGPYVYRVKFERSGVSFARNNTRLSYDLFKTYDFEVKRSIGSEADEIITVNLPILNLATRLLWTKEYVQDNVSSLIRDVNESLFTRVNVSDILWGYENKNLRDIDDFLWINFNLSPLKNTTYGLMFQSAFQGAYEASTGTKNISDLWNIKDWNGNGSLNVWNTTKCDSIKGTDGYAWPPNLNESKTVHIFDSEWCRSIDLVATGHESIDWLSTIVHQYSNDSFGYDGWRRGFCHPIPRGNASSCLRNGVLNVTKCKDNIPLLLSQPHFLNADKSYSNAIHGLKPDINTHTTYFKIDQSSGEVVETSRKLQLNAYVMELSSFPDTKNFKDNPTVIPIAWMEEVYSMTDEERGELTRQRRVYNGVQYGLIGLGALLLVCALLALIIVFVLNRKGKEGERQPLLPD